VQAQVRLTLAYEYVLREHSVVIVVADEFAFPGFTAFLDG